MNRNTEIKQAYLGKLNKVKDKQWLVQSTIQGILGAKICHEVGHISICVVGIPLPDQWSWYDLFLYKSAINYRRCWIDLH